MRTISERAMKYHWYYVNVYENIILESKANAKRSVPYRPQPVSRIQDLSWDELFEIRDSAKRKWK